jgi:hypothetical protein
MFRSLQTRLFAAVFAFFGLSNYAETKVDPNWHWHHITSEPFKEWVKQVPVQLPIKLANGLQVPVEFAVQRLSTDDTPWYVRIPAKLFGASVLYALLLRLLIIRLRSRFGWAPHESEMARR